MRTHCRPLSACVTFLGKDEGYWDPDPCQILCRVLRALILDWLGKEPGDVQT
jgi:hypothetical protein